jgi:hypothetical protein
MATGYTYSDFDAELPKQVDGDIQKDVDVEAIKNSLQNILATRKGSRRMVPDFGSNMDALLFEPMDETTGQRIGDEIIGSIKQWDDRIVIEKVDIEAEPDTNQYTITVDYYLRGWRQKVDTLRIILRKA